MIIQRFLTPEEVESCDLSRGTNYAIAVNDVNNKIIGLFTLDTATRLNPCKSCVQKCAAGGIVWTRTGDRGSGVLRNLSAWALKELDVETVYGSTGSLPPDAKAIHWRFDIIHREESDVGRFDYKRGTELLDALVDRISPLLGYDI
jgi:hypothetical protein